MSKHSESKFNWSKRSEPKLSEPKPCEGIKLTPMKFADIVKSAPPVEAAATPPAVKTHYVPPSKRAQEKEEAKAPSTEDMKSEQSFPTLSAMKPTTNGASWGQIRARLDKEPTTTPSLNFKNVIEERIKREIKEAEEGKRLENMTDPLEMNAQQLEQNGWHVRSMRVDLSEVHDRIMANNPLTEEDYWNSKTDWPTTGWPFEIVHLGGAPIERSPNFNAATYGEGDGLYYTPLSVTAENTARNRLLAFVGKKPVA